MRGAAIFVGAGFSRNAERPARDTPLPPLWSDLVDEMVARLYPHAPISAPRDPLRLAEEFRVYFGQAVLDEFIRTRICDDEWKPGELHRQLLELPWADVLTTNWDTLLERAAKQVSVHDYEPVRNMADLAHARGRRIVKLHGSIGTTEHFIFAEEDYRTYPTVFAAFVNFARQVFVENELCLIGFSGDDPNFLQWSGWVRDHLGGNTRRIYLVGDLDLVPAKRKLLESRNIAPIDLAPLFEKTDTDRDHRQMTAAKLFFEFLGAEKPIPATDWTPAFSYVFAPKTPEDWQRQFKDADYAASLLDKAAEIWKAERESYASWLVCPNNRRTKLRTAMDGVPSPTEKSLEKLAPDRRCHVLYEIAWRHRTAFWPIDAHLAEMMASVADPNQPNALTKTRQLEIACLLLRTGSGGRRRVRKMGINHRDQFQTGLGFYRRSRIPALLACT